MTVRIIRCLDACFLDDYEQRVADIIARDSAPHPVVTTVSSAAAADAAADAAAAASATAAAAAEEILGLRAEIERLKVRDTMR